MSDREVMKAVEDALEAMRSDIDNLLGVAQTNSAKVVRGQSPVTLGVLREFGVVGGTLDLRIRWVPEG